MVIHAYKRQALELDAINTRLVCDLRQMDQFILEMASATTAEEVRAILQRAWVITEERLAKGY